MQRLALSKQKEDYVFLYPERAAEAVYSEMLLLCPTAASICIACDDTPFSRKLLVLCGDRAVLVTSYDNMPSDAPNVWIDALLCEDPPLIERIRQDRLCGSMVISVEHPTGLNGITGKASAPCVSADLTVTFGLPEAGLYLADGLDVCGKIVLKETAEPSDGRAAFIPEEDDLRALLPKRRRNLHKGQCGHLLIIAGSFGMAGAAALCTKAALRSGTGLITVACPASIVPILQTLAPCAMCVPMPERDGAISEAAVSDLESILPGKSAIVCGCGLSRRASPEIIRRVLKADRRTVLDADALNLISEDKSLMAMLTPRHVITPHPGEALRLLRHSMDDPIADALELRALGCEVLLKGATSIIPESESRVWLSPSGCCGMARGGSGDILSGILGALLAEPSERSVAQSALLASELHGLAGEAAQAKYGSRGMCSQDIIDALPEVLKRFE